jgi:hypothetical protein
MREICTYGSVRGVLREKHPYRDLNRSGWFVKYVSALIKEGISIFWLIGDWSSLNGGSE